MSLRKISSTYVKKYVLFIDFHLKLIQFFLQFTNEIYAKEVKSGKTDLVVNETVKNKSKGYIKKYMNTRGPVFSIDHSPTSSSHEAENAVCINSMNDEDAVEEAEVREEFYENSAES